MHQKQFEELSTKPMEIVLAYIECYDLYNNELWDRGEYKEINDFDQFYNVCRYEHKNSFPQYSERQYLNVLYERYGSWPRF